MKKLTKAQSLLLADMVKHNLCLRSNDIDDETVLQNATTDAFSVHLQRTHWRVLESFKIAALGLCYIRKQVMPKGYRYYLTSEGKTVAKELSAGSGTAATDLDRDSDYDWREDTNIYPRDTIILEPPQTEVVQVFLANESGIVGLVDMDVEPTSFVQRKARADAIIAEYHKIGRDAMWAIGKGDGFWLKATDTLPAKYVSMQEAKKEIAIPAQMSNGEMVETIRAMLDDWDKQNPDVAIATQDIDPLAGLSPAERLDRVSDEVITALWPALPEPPANQDHLKFWHCHFCHKGLTARDLHDITDHKVRCFECAAKHEIDPPPTKPAQLSLF